MAFHYSHNLIWIGINVRGRKEPLNFLLDTGAGATVLDLETAKQLGLKFGDRENILAVNSRSIAICVSGFNAEAAGVPLRESLLSVDLSNASRVCGRKIDGLLGADFLQERVVQIDYRVQKIRLYARGEMPAGNAVALPLKQLNDSLCIPVSLYGDKPEWMRMDTGCDENLHVVISRRDRMRNARMTSIGLASSSILSTKIDVQLGRENFSGVTAGIQEHEIFPGESGLVGNGLLSRFKITIDAEAKKVMLEKN